MRYGRFERDQPHTSRRACARPPPSNRPPYPLQLPPNPYTGSSKRLSYADVDAPSIPSFGDLPSAGYTGFTEDLYDDQPPKPEKQASQPTALHQSRHTPNWPTFSNPLHARRHVDIPLLNPTTPLSTLVQYLPTANIPLLSLSTHRTVRVLSPTQTTVTNTLTLEFPHGATAAAFVGRCTRSTEALAVVGSPVHRADPSPPISRTLGEAIWRGGASRVVVIEDAGAALRVPANLRYQVESCAYRKREEVLQQEPEFLEDGAVRLVFMDVRDARVAVETWAKREGFRDVKVGYEREGAVPALGEDGVEGEGMEAIEEATEDGSDETSSGGEVGKEGDGDGKQNERHGCSDSDSGSVSLSARSGGYTAESTGLEREEDEGYAAGSSDYFEDLPIPRLPPLAGSSDNLEDLPINPGQPHLASQEAQRSSSESVRSEEGDGKLNSRMIDFSVSPTEQDYSETSSGEDDAPRRTTIAQDDTTPFLNYDDDSPDSLKDGEIREASTLIATPSFSPRMMTTIAAPCTQNDHASPRAPQRQMGPEVSAAAAAAASSPHMTPRMPAAATEDVDDAAEEEVFKTPGGTVYKPGTASPERIRSLMGKSRWAA